MGFTMYEKITPELEFDYDEGLALHVGNPTTVSIKLSQEEMTKLVILWLRCMDLELGFWDHSKLTSRIACRRLSDSL